MVRVGLRAMRARYSANKGVASSGSRYGASSDSSVASYWNGTDSAYGSRKKSNGLSTAISAIRSTSTRNSRVRSGNTRRAR